MATTAANTNELVLLLCLQALLVITLDAGEYPLAELLLRANHAIFCRSIISLQFIAFFEQCGSVVRSTLDGQILLTSFRFTAIAFPLKYRTWFAAKTTFSVLSFITLIAGLYWSAYFVGRNFTANMGAMS
ncbi:hypothetical protein ANCDUO_04657 [Ancylostoma duodenale]|uniref:7TM GPCR serpentine receptor class x (Srx) domain-containing protein n=1 Tax=Ancylostoma duodenale TaxID=51022 RepID=A0A0C2D612_9BILA|nr:hypothetical protein ANCDUO_04657 [Ancylostoma duodenale]